MKEVLTVNTNGKTQKFFIMGNHGQIPDTPYFNTMKDASIYMFKMDKSKYTNIYDMSENQYTKLIKE